MLDMIYMKTLTKTFFFFFVLNLCGCKSVVKRISQLKKKKIPKMLTEKEIIFEFHLK